ncbi:MAG: DUF2306 domain-containing protein [Pseudomonadota bacterium]
MLAPSAPVGAVAGHRFLTRTATAWFLVALVGQVAFIIYTFGFYGPRTFSGEWHRWNDAQLITGFVDGDPLGNAVFASHVLLAGVITLGGIFQLIPWLRRRATWLHRLNGRIFVVTAYLMAIGGLAATWGRGSYLSVISAVAVSLNAAMILAFATMALRRAMQGRIAEHERWAMRLFMACNGVWFFRLALMAWILINQGPRGMNDTLSGPADIALQFGSFLMPFVVLELYQAAKRSPMALPKRAVSTVIIAAIVITGLGIFGTSAFMWLPRLML